MKKFTKFLEESSEDCPYLQHGYEKESCHYKSYPGHNDVFNGKSRFYIPDHAYFAQHAKVNIPEIYSGIKEGSVKHILKHKDDHHLTYVIGVTLPQGHSEAEDEDGNPQYDKHILLSDKELFKHNPKIKWDGK